MKRFIILMIFLIAMLSACSSLNKDNSTSENEVENNNVNSEDKYVEKKEKKEKKKESERDLYKENDKKFKFNKNIQVVHVKEVNNEALNDRPSGGIASQEALYYKGKLYLYNDVEQLPTEATEMIVIEDQYNHDYMLNYKLHQTNSNKVDFDLKPIDNEFINNNNRLFINKSISINMVSGSESISLSVNGETYEIPKGKSEKISIKKGEIESTILVSNYGLLNSIKNMYYQDPIELEEEYVEQYYDEES